MSSRTTSATSSVTNYVTPLIVHDGVGYLSGQLPRLNGELQHVGTVGKDLDVDTARAAARLSAQVCIDVLDLELGEGKEYQFDRLLKITGYIASTPGFSAHGRVLDAASAVFQDTFGEAGRHARSAIGVSSLPHGACLEIEITVATRPGQGGAR